MKQTQERMANTETGNVHEEIIRKEMKSINNLYPDGSVGMFMRVTLVILYMYLIFAGHMMMGMAGVLLVSGLFLVALLFPIGYYFAKRARNDRTSSPARDTDELLTNANQEA